ncbi:MAG: hypothetical protein SFU98_10285, partial [Leptospiraceae bacterium]|nr:hypothetical protein [Leptospiraceae bacterium]
RRLARSIEDIARLCGFETQEIYEFLLFGAELELETLKETYDWERFNRTIVKKLKKAKEL